MTETQNSEAQEQIAVLAEVVRRMTRRIEAGNTESAIKLGLMAWEAAKTAGVRVRDWDSGFAEG